MKQLRLAGVCTMEAANAYLDAEFLPEWDQQFTVAAANSTDAHRPLTPLHNLAATLSRVELRTIATDYTDPVRRQAISGRRAAACAWV